MESRVRHPFFFILVLNIFAGSRAQKSEPLPTPIVVYNGSSLVYAGQNYGSNTAKFLAAVPPNSVLSFRAGTYRNTWSLPAEKRLHFTAFRNAQQVYEHVAFVPEDENSTIFTLNGGQATIAHILFQSLQNNSGRAILGKNGTRSRLAVDQCEFRDFDVAIGGTFAELVLRDFFIDNARSGIDIFGPVWFLIRVGLISNSRQFGLTISGSGVFDQACVVDVHGLQLISNSGGGLAIYATPEGIFNFFDCTFRDNVGVNAILVGTDEVGFYSCFFSSARSLSGGSWGDGLSVWKSRNAIYVVDCRFENNARAGLSNFGSLVVITSSYFAGHAFDWNCEEYGGCPGNFDGSRYNTCPDTGSCRAESSSIAPPAPLSPVGAPEPIGPIGCYV